MLRLNKNFELDEEAKLLSCLEAIGAVADTTEIHEDIYYAHPARDFRQTTEALRIRVVNGVDDYVQGTKIAWEQRRFAKNWSGV